MSDPPTPQPVAPAAPEPPSLPKRAVQAFLATRTSGKLLLIGGAIGVASGFLPAMRVQMLWVSQSSLVLDNPAGECALLGYVATLVSTLLLSRSADAPSRALAWTCVASCALAVLFSAIQFVQTAHAVSNAVQITGPLTLISGMQSGYSLGAGSYGVLIAAVLCAIGGLMTAKQTKLFAPSPKPGSVS